MKRKAFLLFVLFFCPILEAGVIFSDDFEDGTLDKWVINGRQEETGIAEVIMRNGSQMAHLYHSGITEITLGKIFEYSPELTFYFDMEAHVSSPYEPTSVHYSASGVIFEFLDTDNNILGRAVHTNSSSTYLYDYYNPLPNWEIFEIEDDQLHSYTINAVDMLSCLEVEESLVESLNFYFWAYGSALQSSLEADVWVDNVVVIPEPGTLILMSFGVLGLLRRNRNSK